MNILAKADGITWKANPTKADDITLKAKADDITLKAKADDISKDPVKTGNVQPSGDGTDMEEEGFLDDQDLARLNQASWRTYRIAAVLIAANAKRFL